MFVHYPEGEVIEPVLAEPGQYFEKPIYDNGRFIMLLVDFPLAKINIIAYKPETKKISSLVTLPLAVAENCRNLALRLSPLMLVRQSDDKFQILWPENKSFPIGSTEGFYFRKEEKLYFSAWYEDPDYRVEIIIRDFDTGEVIKRCRVLFALCRTGSNGFCFKTAICFAEQLTKCGKKVSEV